MTKVCYKVRYTSTITGRNKMLCFSSYELARNRAYLLHKLTGKETHVFKFRMNPYMMIRVRTFNE